MKVLGRKQKGESSVVSKSGAKIAPATKSGKGSSSTLATEGRDPTTEDVRKMTSSSRVMLVETVGRTAVEPERREPETKEPEKTVATGGLEEEENVVLDTFTAFPVSVAQSIAADVASSYAHTKRKSIVAMEKAKSDSISAMEKAKADSLRSIEDAKAKVSDGVKSWTPFGGGDDEVTIEEERSEVETNLSKPVDSSVATNQASRGIRVHGFRNGATDETEPETYSPTVEETPKKDERNKAIVFLDTITAFPKSLCMGDADSNISCAAFAAHTMIDDVGAATVVAKEAFMSSAQSYVNVLTGFCTHQTEDESFRSDDVTDSQWEYDRQYQDRENRREVSKTSAKDKALNAIGYRNGNKRPSLRRSQKKQGSKVKVFGMRKSTPKNQQFLKPYEMVSTISSNTATTFDTLMTELDQELEETRPAITVLFSQACEMEKDSVAVEATRIDDVEGAAMFLTDAVASGAEIYVTVRDNCDDHDDKDVDESPQKSENSPSCLNKVRETDDRSKSDSSLDIEKVLHPKSSTKPESQHSEKQNMEVSNEKQVSESLSQCQSEASNTTLETCESNVSNSQATEMTSEKNETDASNVQVLLVKSPSHAPSKTTLEENETVIFNPSLAKSRSMTSKKASYQGNEMNFFGGFFKAFGKRKSSRLPPPTKVPEEKEMDEAGVFSGIELVLDDTQTVASTVASTDASTATNTTASSFFS